MRRTGIFLATFFIANISIAQSLEEIARKSVAARGGREKIKAVRSERMTGRFRSTAGVESALSVELSRPDRIRTEIQFREGPFIQAFDGKTGWLQSPFGESREPKQLSAREAAELAESADMDGPFVDWKERGIQLELLGREKFKKHDVFKIRVQEKNGTPRTVRLDAVTFLKFEWEGQLEKEGTTTTFVSLFDDYRDVGGLRLPFRIRSSASESPRSTTITFEKIEIDPAIETSRFSLSAPTRR